MWAHDLYVEYLGVRTDGPQEFTLTVCNVNGLQKEARLVYLHDQLGDFVARGSCRNTCYSVCTEDHC